MRVGSTIPHLLPHRGFTVDGSQFRVRGPTSDVAKSEEGVPSEAGDIWLALAGVPPRQQPLQVPSDIGGSGGVPRRATAWETEARSVAFLFARIVNTEGPGP